MIDIKKSSNPNIYVEMLLLEFMNNFKMNSKQINSKSQGNDTPNSLKIHSLDKTVENSVNLIEKSEKETENFHKMEKETAKDLKQILEDNNMLRDDVEEVPKYEYYVSDIPEKFAAIAEEFLKKEIDDIKNVEIQQY